jgi:Nucleotidyl transferase AbiEii toxin, Type IV TA system
MSVVPISEAHRAALEKLASVLPADYYLAGGVGVAAHLEHRSSRDLDLFGASDPTDLRSRFESIDGLVIESQSHGTLHARIDGIPVSLIEYRYALLDEAAPTADLAVRVASLCDLACMKLSAIASRGAARDFWDLHAIIISTRRDLSHYLEAFTRKYPVEDPGHVIRSLVYFDDAGSAPLPLGLGESHWATIRADFERWVRPLVTS